ncbi:hypothetical protein CALCODRAFT_507038 [Calocera cornea HHB12733]|uniref:Uncharacterized protein n=1 Tax=Calocera cornea HHB12733 TaxID=1353952 RepID=A0A165I6Y0_9BASI|nr:hypothetical protein CALCODRAFT_507038 [Calocera cornea HHB12733]
MAPSSVKEGDDLSDRLLFSAPLIQLSLHDNTLGWGAGYSEYPPLNAGKGVKQASRESVQLQSGASEGENRGQVCHVGDTWAANSQVLQRCLEGRNNVRLRKVNDRELNTCEVRHPTGGKKDSLQGYVPEAYQSTRFVVKGILSPNESEVAEVGPLSGQAGEIGIGEFDDSLVEGDDVDPFHNKVGLEVLRQTELDIAGLKLGSEARERASRNVSIDFETFEGCEGRSGQLRPGSGTKDVGERRCIDESQSPKTNAEGKLTGYLPELSRQMRRRSGPITGTRHNADGELADGGGHQAFGYVEITGGMKSNVNLRCVTEEWDMRKVDHCGLYDTDEI